LIVFCVFEEG